MKPDYSQSGVVNRPEDWRLVHWRDLAACWRVLVRRRRAVCLRYVQRACFTVGVLCLGYCGSVLLEAAIVQRQARGLLDEWRAQQSDAPLATTNAAPIRGAVLASLESPRIGLSVMVLEGTDRRTLRVGAGHLPGTPLPGQDGNMVIAGHRDTFFRPLSGIKVGDEINLTSPQGQYRYQIIWSRIVPPSETQPLEPTPEASLTLVTCYPFAYVGAAPNRLVIRAARVEASTP